MSIEIFRVLSYGEKIIRHAQRLYITQYSNLWHLEAPSVVTYSRTQNNKC
jgi:hypothetical protein